LSHIENDKFGEIVLSLGFCTVDQIRRCLEIQGETTENLSLGQSLLREGFISDEQYSRVLTQLRRSFKKGTPVPHDQPPVATPGSPAIPKVPNAEDRVDDLLGKLAVQEGWLTTADLIACLRAEKPGAPRRPLGEILVDAGYLTPARAKELFARVSRRVMCCRPCGKKFTVLSIAQSRNIACPRCQGPLEDEKLPNLRPAKDPLVTQTVKAIAQSLPPSRRPRLR
jgi:hypothetical protein